MSGDKSAVGAAGGGGTAAWRVEMLGGLRLRSGDVTVTRFRTQKTAALLAYLTLKPGRQHAREELADLFWPDADFESARVSLRTALSSVRRLLATAELPGEQIVLAHGNQTVSLDHSRIETDVAAFEAAVRRKRWGEARRLYAGPLLPGFYDDWALTERERLEALFGQVEAHPAEEEAEDEAGSSRPAPPRVLLPPDPGRLYGRDEVLGRLGELLAEHRLVTLTGPGGIGKTRLAMAAARRHAAQFAGGIVAFAPLAEVSDPRRILAAVRDALGLPRDPRAEPLEQVAELLRGDTPSLLVLDNFEQVAAGGAPFAQALLARVPALTLLVTSRRRLGLPGERQVTLGSVAEGAGVRLFADRAQAVYPEFALTDENAAEVAALVRDLEGVPLAVELAAARAQSLTPAQMRARLADALAGPDRFAFLAETRGRDKSERHRSLWATMDWSYRLLTPEQRRLFSRLSVFRGGWTTRAAEEVADEPFALEYLAQLRERSLLVAGEAEREVRWGMLESLREFAAEQVPEGEREALAARHAGWAAALAARIRQAYTTPREADAMAEAERERGNLEAAIRHLSGADVDAALDLAADIGYFWYSRGYLREGEQIVAALLERAGDALPANAHFGPAGPPRLRARITIADLLRDQGRLTEAEAHLRAALAGAEIHLPQTEALAARARQGLGLIAVDRGDTAGAHEHLAAAGAYWERAGNVASLALTLTNRTRAFVREGREAEAVGQGERALALYRDIGSEWGIATILSILAIAYQGLGDRGRVRRANEESLSRYRAIGNRYGVATCLRGLGYLALSEERWDEAVSVLHEALSLSRDLGDRWSAAIVLSYLAACYAHRGDAERAARLLGWRGAYDAAEAITRTPPEEAVVAAQTEFVRSLLGDDRFARLLEEGAVLAFEQAVALVLDPA